MKHKRTIILCAAFSLLASVTISYVAIEKKTYAIFNQNVNALSDGESSGISICYNQFTFHLVKRCLVCGTCNIVWGEGTSEGGICY